MTQDPEDNDFVHEKRVEEPSTRHAVSAQVYRRSREENLIILNFRRLHFVIEESRHFFRKYWRRTIKGTQTPSVIGWWLPGHDDGKSQTHGDSTA